MCKLRLYRLTAGPRNYLSTRVAIVTKRTKECMYAVRLLRLLEHNEYLNLSFATFWCNPLKDSEATFRATNNDRSTPFFGTGPSLTHPEGEKIIVGEPNPLDQSVSGNGYN